MSDLPLIFNSIYNSNRIIPLYNRIIKFSLNSVIQVTTHQKWGMSTVEDETFGVDSSQSARFSHSVVSNSLRPHGLHHARLPHPSSTPRAYSNSWPPSWWCQPTNSSSVVPFSSRLPSIRVFSRESVLCIRWPKYWSCRFRIIRSNEYSGLISFRTDWLDILAGQGTLKSLLQHHSSKHQFFSAQPSL